MGGAGIGLRPRKIEREWKMMEMKILKRRYASGEIDREEFERIKESLMS
jgi:uncharacterized membrane protein